VDLHYIKLVSGRLFYRGKYLCNIAQVDLETARRCLIFRSVKPKVFLHIFR